MEERRERREKRTEKGEGGQTNQIKMQIRKQRRWEGGGGHRKTGSPSSSPVSLGRMDDR